MAKKAAGGKVAAKISLWVEAMIQNGGNGAEAAVAAGYKRGVAARQAAHRMSTNVTAVRLLAERRSKVVGEAMEITGLSVERTLREVARIAYFQPKRMFDAEGKRIPIHELPDEVAAALGSIEYEELKAGRGEEAAVIGETVKVKAWDKRGALDMAMKHHGEYERDNKQKNDPRNMTDEELEAEILRETEALAAIEKAQVSSRKAAKAAKAK